MASITNLDPQRRILPQGILLVEDVSMDEEVWELVEDYLAENGKAQEMKFDSNFRINAEGKCMVRLAKNSLTEF